VPVQLLNLEHRAISVPAYQAIARLEVDFHASSLDPDEKKSMTGAYDRLDAETKALIDSVEVDPLKLLSHDQRRRVDDLLAYHARVFAENPKKPNHTHAMRVELPLKPDAKPHRHAAARHGEEGRLLVERHVAEMEANGIIRKSNSAWGSRVVLVQKKSGETRFCIDYRDLNSKLETLDSPIPRCDEAIDRLASGQGSTDSLWLSTLDLASGFWTLPIAEADKPLTAFVTHRQKYEWNYLPFGVQSGPSYMCRLMDAALQGLAWDVCMPYLDDVAVWSTGVGANPAERSDASFEQMMHRRDLVLERLTWAGLSAKASKCTFFTTSASYLGHVISRQGLEMDPAKISTVRNFDPTRINTLEAVRSFLGLCSYYRRFVDGFARLAGPLHDLTKTGVNVAEESQKPPAQAAMRALIIALTSQPVLMLPQFDRPFIVKTDAAITQGIGGVLSQLDDDGHERVVAYYGRRLTPAERNYTVTEIELLAAKECIRNWRPYLWGRKFSLVIDHAALRWLHTMKDTVEGGPASRLQRWCLVLAEYEFDVIHKPGIIHKDADAVSRLVAAVCATADSSPQSKGADVALAHSRQAFASWLASTTEFEPKMITAVQTEYTERVWAAGVVTARTLRSKERLLRAAETTRASIISDYVGAGPDVATLRQAQDEDEECQMLRRVLATGTAMASPTSSSDLRRCRWAVKEAQFLTVIEGVLHRLTPNADKTPSEPKVWVPRELRHAYLTAFHDRLGHQGVDRTTRVLRARCYWPGLAHDAREHVGDCHDCGLAKRIHPSSAPTAPRIGAYPFDIVVTDILDLVETHDGKYDKVVFFMDTLSRWVEAVPCHGSPTSEELLDYFYEHVVTRHGMPRELRSDAGSNVASRLCKGVLDAGGADLNSSTPHHHETAGLVERFNDTIASMIRACNEGGSNWADHLPYLLFAYRATPNRATKLSPASIVYGHELRLPAQPSVGADIDTHDAPDPNDLDAVHAYLVRLEKRIRIAWDAATEASKLAQWSDKSNAERTNRLPEFEIGDWVYRKLHEHENKCTALNAGPYRIAGKHGRGNYTLADRENNIMSTKWHVSNLKAITTEEHIDDLAPDEFFVDEILKHRAGRQRLRTSSGHRARQYRVKWRGYPRSKATWITRTELERRCRDIVDAYDAANHLPSSDPTDTETQSTPPVPATAPTNDAPYEAKFARGHWAYARRINTSRGQSVRWFQDASFTPTELASAHFDGLRQAALLTDRAAPVAAIIRLSELSISV
jgi:hypothetical protein